MQRRRLKTEITGPYIGMRISGASDDVVEARFTVEYDFGTVVIVVENIPGRWDLGNDRELVSGQVASQVQKFVNQARASAHALVHIDASNLSPAA